ncbi:MAG: GHKL domain-containing protein [Firmicutes bacterium]|nr:GHKL domain-containing protein [Bacillota bacterium]
MYIFDLLYNVVMTFVVGTLQFYFLCRFTGKKTKILNFILYILILYIQDKAAYFAEMNISLELFVLYGISRISLKNSPLISGTAVILDIYVSMLSFGILNSPEEILLPYISSEKTLILMVIAASIMSVCLCFLCYRLILNQFYIGEAHREPYILMLLPPGLFFYAAEYYIIHIAYGNTVTTPVPVEPAKHLSLLAIQLLGLAVMFSALYAYRRVCAGLQAQTDFNMLEKEVKAQKTYVEQAKLRYDQTQSLRHDMKNHLTVLGGLLKKGEIDMAEDYLDKLDAAASGLSFHVNTGNPVIDILLEDKLNLAKAEEIDIEISLRLNAVNQAVDDFDLCVIFANALDNAITACGRVEERRKLSVTGERQGDFYMFEFENTCTEELMVQTGTGLSNIRAAAEKYGGAVSVEKQSGIFRLNVLLNISAQ